MSLGGSAGPRVALVTCAELPELDADTQLLLAPLAERDVEVTAAVWSDPGVDWAAFDLAVVRCCWDYVPRRADFLAWAERVPRLANPADVLVWNTDKRYLRELGEAGIPVVPTRWLEPEDSWEPGTEGEWVIKPAVSASALDSGRYRLDDPGEHRLALEHLHRLQQAGRTVMVQPYMAGVDRDGETALVYLGGEYSHTIRKAAVLTGPDQGLDKRFHLREEHDMLPRQASAAQLALAERVLAAVPGGRERLLYARVDLVPGPEGEPCLIELELTEPQLFFARVPGTADRMAEAIVRTALGYLPAKPVTM